ncbi:MAG: thioredoxin domain-containing protein [Kineosporiaceae bacterium]
MSDDAAGPVQDGPVAGSPLPPPAPVSPEPPTAPAAPVGATRAGGGNGARLVAAVALLLVGGCLGSVITLIVTQGSSGSGTRTVGASAPASQAASQAGAPSAAPGRLVEPRNTTQGAIVVGNPQAPVHLRVYEDYLCPYCGEFERENAQQLARWIEAGTVSVDYRTVAILDEATSTAYSTRAAMASAAVRDTSPAAWPAFHAALFASQPAEGGAGLTDATLAGMAAQVGASADVVREALADRRYAPWVGAVTQSAGQGPDKLSGTPTVILVDVKANKSTQVEDWSAEALRTSVEALLPRS